jgi:hypothetical protein
VQQAPPSICDCKCMDHTSLRLCNFGRSITIWLPHGPTKTSKFQKYEGARKDNLSYTVHKGHISKALDTANCHSPERGLWCPRPWALTNPLGIFMPQFPSSEDLKICTTTIEARLGIHEGAHIWRWHRRNNFYLL